MRILFISIVLSIFIYSTSYAQQNNIGVVYYYQDNKIHPKPQPNSQRKFNKWIKLNNQLIGKMPRHSRSTATTLVFIVDMEGNIQNPQIWKGIGGGFDQEAFRLLMENPYPWNPGKEDGLPVAVKVYFQIDFLNNNNRVVSKDNQPLTVKKFDLF